MNESIIKEQCRNLNERQAACFSISCFGMLSFATSDFLADHKEIFSIWKVKELPLDENLFSIGFEKLVAALETSASTSYQSDPFFHDYYLNSYLNGDDKGTYSGEVTLFLNIPTDLARAADAFLSGSNFAEKNLGTGNPVTLAPELAFDGARMILCMSLFNESEAVGSAALEEFASSACWAQAIQDFQLAVDLAKQEKVIPFGDRKWDYKFFGYDSSDARKVSLLGWHKFKRLYGG